MGSIKIETKNQGRGSHEWDNISLNNIDAIDVLIRFRHKFDQTYLSKKLYTYDIYESNGIPEFTEIITCLYVDLDKYIKRANFTDYELDIIKYLMMGYLFEDIIKLVNKKYDKDKTLTELKRNFRRSICLKILDEYKYDYQNWLHLSEKIKINKNETYKMCTKCKKYKILNSINFGKRADSKDKYHYWCRKCMTVLAYKSKIPKKIFI